MATTGTTWTTEQLERIDTADELEIAVRRDDGTLRPWLPLWVVRVGDGYAPSSMPPIAPHTPTTGAPLDPMVADAAAAATLRLVPERPSRGE